MDVIGLDGAFDAVGRAAASFDEEERELWRQLRRKRDFEGRVAEKRTQLAELQDRRRAVSRSLAEAGASVEQLTGELNFVRQQEREMEHDIAVLKESNRILQHAFQSQQQQQWQPPGAVALGAIAAATTEFRQEPRDPMAEERARRESVQQQHEQIAHLRAHLERLRAEKAALQTRQAALFDRQRSAEQDRNRLIGTLQDDRSGINELRAERIRLWEERAAMEREMARILHDAQSDVGERGAEASRAAAVAPPGTAGGVRGHVSHDTPLAFTNGGGDGAKASLWDDEATGVPSPPPAESQPARPHWTGFSDGAGPELGGGLGKVGAAGDGLLFGGLSAPPSFGHLGGSGGGASPGGLGGASPGFGGASPGSLGGTAPGGFGGAGFGDRGGGASPGGLGGSSQGGFGGAGQGGFGGASPGSGGGAGSLGGGASAGLGSDGFGVTEWSGTLRDFKANAGGATGGNGGFL